MKTDNYSLTTCFHLTQHKSKISNSDEVQIFMCKPSSSVPHLLRVFEEFGDLSGFRINWLKSAFLLLMSTKLAHLPADISMVEHFTSRGRNITHFKPDCEA